MFLTILDLVLILILFLFIAFGFALGFIQTLGAVVGIFIGTWAAGAFNTPIAEWLTPLLLGRESLARIIAFILIFTIVNRLVGFAFYLIGKIFGLLSIIPFLKTFNRLFGALIGFLEGVLSIGVILFFVSRVTIVPWFTEAIAGSKVATWLQFAAGIVTPLLPEWLRIINV